MYSILTKNLFVSLAGLVGYNSSHFVAYCRRYSGAWQVYNDLHENIEPGKSETKIEPHLAVYVRQQEDEA